MKITALTENTSQNGLPAEHGLSLFLQTERHTILFDTGQSDLFARNAQALGVDLRAVDIAVLSHGHYDHGGGLKTFLALNDHAPVYLHRLAFEPHYNGDKAIGLDTALQKSDRLRFTEGVTKLDEGLTLFDANDLTPIVPVDPCGLDKLHHGVRQPDDFRHEQYLLIEENGTRVLISGCSHKGVLNLAHWFRPDHLIGGFHLHKHPLDDALTRCARQLDAYGTTYYTCHCTGTAQYAFMKPTMRRLHYLSAGDTIEIAT